MKVAGGVIALIAGIFGFIAAVITLFFGGIATAVAVHDASTVVGLGWGGLVFSFVVIVLGACAIGSKSRWAGYLLIVSSIAGAILGGTLVAICMVLALVGGVLSLIGSRGVLVTAPTSPVVASAVVAANGNSKTTRNLLIALIVVVVVFGSLIIIGSKNKSGDSTVASEPETNSDTPLQQLAKAQPADIAPTGALAQMFELGGKNTDLQRDNTMSSIKGKVVQWKLPVFDVHKTDDGYRIQTKSGVSLLDSGAGTVETFVDITPQSDADRRLIENLKEDDIVTVRGVISDESMRHLVLDPAIVVPEDGVTDSSAQANSPSSEVVSNATTLTKGASPAIQSLLNKEEALNDKCRGGSGDDPATQGFCDQRNKVLQELDSKGWCYGTEDQIEADKVWQRCAKKAREALAAPEPTLPDSPLSIASNPPPSYPPQAIRQGHHGTAILVIDVGVDGVPTDVQVEQTSGFRELDKAAIDAAQKWRFNPEVRNGQKVEGQARTPFAFN